MSRPSPLPAVDRVLNLPAMQSMIARFGRTHVVETVRNVMDEIRVVSEEAEIAQPGGNGAGEPRRHICTLSRTRRGLRRSVSGGLAQCAAACGVDADAVNIAQVKALIWAEKINS